MRKLKLLNLLLLCLLYSCNLLGDDTSEPLNFVEDHFAKVVDKPNKPDENFKSPIYIEGDRKPELPILTGLIGSNKPKTRSMVT